MPTRKTTSVTPWLQWLVLCEAVTTDDDGVVSLRRTFDGVTVPTLPVMIPITISAQFRGGQGEHKYWLRVVPPNDDEEVETPEVSFWLPSSAAAHRQDARITIGLKSAGKYWFVAILDGREVGRIPMEVTSFTPATTTATI